MYKDFQLPIGNNLPRTQLGFLAYSLLFNNPTDQFWYIPILDTYVSPHTLSNLYSLPFGTQVAEIKNQSPPGQEAVGQPTQYATVRYMAQTQSDVAGILTPIPSAQTSKLLATYTIAVGANSTPSITNIPSTTRSITILLKAGSTGIPSNFLDVRGTQSNYGYITVADFTTGFIKEQFEFYPQLDSGLTFNINGPPSGATALTVYVIAHFEQLTPDRLRVYSLDRFAALTSTDRTPKNVTIANSSTSIVSANVQRRYLAITNDSDKIIYLGFYGIAVLNKGIRLNANGGAIDFYGENNWIDNVHGICAAGGANLTYQEF